MDHTHFKLLLLSHAKFLFRLSSLAVFFAVCISPVVNVRKTLALPKPELCASTSIHATLGGSGVAHTYYFSWEEEATRNLFLNWLDARNWCRERCMDLVSLETPPEYQLVKDGIKKYTVQYVWTSGRLCDFEGCDRPDLQPPEVNGWFWSGSNRRMRPTNESSPYNHWSHTGGLRRPQPDNRGSLTEGGVPESCMAILNNYYGDGIKWHDVGCHHLKSFVCENSPKLLQYAKAINKNFKLELD